MFQGPSATTPITAFSQQEQVLLKAGFLNIPFAFHQILCLSLKF